MLQSPVHLDPNHDSAGRSTLVPTPPPVGRRLEVLSRSRIWASEVETSGKFAHLWQAASRLAESSAPQKMIRVPLQYMGMAATVLMRAGVSAWVRNLNGPEEFFVKARPH
jgi:hypothetical protein